jgi:hypothetical protein
MNETAPTAISKIGHLKVFRVVFAIVMRSTMIGVATVTAAVRDHRLRYERSAMLCPAMTVRVPSRPRKAT